MTFGETIPLFVPSMADLPRFAWTIKGLFRIEPNYIHDRRVNATRRQIDRSHQGKQQ